jgi:hypothetical protein
MGVEKNITISKFPHQGSWLGKKTKVCFHFDANSYIMGTIIRDDMEEPFRTIISLDDGRVILATECMHSPQS